MNKYNEIIGLYDYFQPTYDLTNEVADYWKQFVPNDKFFSILRGVLNSLESQQANEKKSLWLQGTYGTGKSHATAVVKHLLFDEADGLEEFTEKFEDPQLKSRILGFRDKFRVFPVVIKGLSNVTDNRTFALVIERAVKDALKKSQIQISTKSDFEKMVYQIETNPGHINWETVIQQYPQINMYVKNKKALLKKLKDGDLDTLRNLEEVSSEIGIHFSNGKIDEWLTEVTDELRSQNKANGLMIYWDEFTSVLQRSNSGMLLTELQHIAELSVNKGIYLFIVSHKTLQQTEMNVTKDDMEKALGRFQLLDYSMEPITTYHIVGAAIKKKDEEIWRSLRDENTAVLDNMIRRIVGTEGGVRNYNRLKDLFPIHPYTAYLSTFIVRNIGSTERSIFNFLYDEDRGFKKFINENPVNNHVTLLTADYLWDFFMNEFERVDYQRFSTVLDKYNLYIKSIEKENHAYGVIFRGVLLLNVLYKTVNVAETKETFLVAPSIDNIRAMFSGTEYESETDAALEFFDAEKKISKDPDNLFLVMSSVLPSIEVKKVKTELKSQYNQIDKILGDHTEEIKIAFTSAILRETEMNIFDASLNQHLLRSKLNKAFKFAYSLHIVLLIAQNIQEREQIKETVLNISQDGETDNVIFIILDDLFDEKVLDKFIEYNARAVVAERRNYREEQVSSHDYANKTLEQWVNGIKSGYADWYLGRDKGKTLISDFSTIVNDNLSATIFYSGLETLAETKKNKNVWDKKSSKASVERFLFANNRDAMESNTSSAPYKFTREVIKSNEEYIVDNQLQFNREADTTHPLVGMNREIEEAIKQKNNSSVFNLGESLKFLTRPPFGLYPNMLCMATLGFLMRNYVGKLYESGKGKPIEKEVMRDKILSMFKYWENGKDSNKLKVRLGTKEEEILIKELAFVFSLENIESLNDAKWGIRNWIKESKFPLWVFKLSENSNDEITLAIDKITGLIESLDEEFTDSDVKSLLNIIKLVEIDLKRLIKKERARELFVSWLQRIDNIEIEREDIDSVIKYIRQHMSEEPGVHSWKEDNVREKAKDWFLEKSRPLTPPPPPPLPPYPPGGEGKLPLGEVGERKTKETMINKIEKFAGDWKEVLRKIIDKHPEFIDILDRYMK